MRIKYKNFTDEEVYILKRQAVESSFDIVMTDRYSDYEKKMHNKLLNELTEEDRFREYGR